MTVLGENPGEQYFDTPAVSDNATISTHVAYIKGIAIFGEGGAEKGTLSGTSSVAITGFSNSAYLIVSGW